MKIVNIQAAKTHLSRLVEEAAAASSSARLPWHHSDPFDRLLIAQALGKNFRFAKRDSFAGLYGVAILKV